ncbi:MAG: NUDIX domain-containing protein [Phycisphaerales bacterium]
MIRKSRPWPCITTSWPSNAGRYLFQQRPSTGLWSNMWQLPTVEDWKAKVDTDTVTRRVREQSGLVTKTPKPVGTFKHQTTHRTISFHVWRMRVASGRLRPGTGQWRGLTDLNDLPLPNPQRAAIKMLDESQ